MDVIKLKLDYLTVSDSYAALFFGPINYRHRI